MQWLEKVLSQYVDGQRREEESEKAGNVKDRCTRVAS